MKSLVLLLLMPTTAFAQYRFENGVFPEMKQESKGHFHLAEHNGRYLFVTPDGSGFYPIGINHLNNVFMKQRGEQSDADPQVVISNMDKWGFNCAGYGTDRRLIDEGIYFIGNLNLVKHGFYHLNRAKFPDVFDEAFETVVKGAIQQAARAYYKPDRLIGVVWSDLPAWSIFKSRMLRQTDWVTEIRNLERTAPGKRAYLRFLRKRYEGDTDALKEYYKLSDDDLADLETHDFTTLYLGHPMVMKDDQLFMAEIAKMYYELGAKYHDEFFPNIPLLGDRFLLGDHPDAVLKVAAQYVDAISIQVGDGFGETMLPSYPYPKATLDHIHEITKKPVLIADHQVSFYTNDYKSTIFSQAGNEMAASLETEKFLRQAYSEEYVCGYFRCTYLTKDEPHGRGVKQGIVDFNGKPYLGITGAYSNVNHDISEYIEESGR